VGEGLVDGVGEGLGPLESAGGVLRDLLGDRQAAADGVLGGVQSGGREVATNEVGQLVAVRGAQQRARARSRWNPSRV
jgi:hypothetical protein